MDLGQEVIVGSNPTTRIGCPLLKIKNTYVDCGSFDSKFHRCSQTSDFRMF